MHTPQAFSWNAQNIPHTYHTCVLNGYNYTFVMFRLFSTYLRYASNNVYQAVLVISYPNLLTRNRLVVVPYIALFYVISNALSFANSLLVWLIRSQMIWSTPKTKTVGIQMQNMDKRTWRQLAWLWTGCECGACDILHVLCSIGHIFLNMRNICDL